MVTLTLAAGSEKLSAHGKRIVAFSMYEKGNAFVAAALLLRQKDGNEYAVLHLLCQGVEVTLKAILLFIDYDKYKPLLKGIGHNLVKASDLVAVAVGVPVQRGNLRAELEALGRLYSQHLLRYGSPNDIFIHPSTIPSHLVLYRFAAMHRLIERRRLLYAPAI